MVTEIWVNIRPLPEPMLINHQWSPVTFILGQFHKACSTVNHTHQFEIYLSKISFKSPRGQWVKTWRPEQNGSHFTDIILKYIFSLSNQISLKFVPNGLIDYNSGTANDLVLNGCQAMTWTNVNEDLWHHVTEPQWVIKCTKQSMNCNTAYCHGVLSQMEYSNYKKELFELLHAVSIMLIQNHY